MIPISKRPYQPAPDRDEKLESLRQAVQHVLAMDNVLDTHKRSLLDVLLWRWTGIDGKWNLQYRSEGVLAGDASPMRHEHVVERKKLITRLLDDPDNYRRILDSAVGCLVTLDEHTQLRRVDKSLDGWARYEAAKIVVHDMATKNAQERDG